MNIEFRKLTEINRSSLKDLMNNPLVRKQMPLFTGAFDDEALDNFIEAKMSLWKNHGLGPWAFVIEGEFAGWGGIQPEDGDYDLALVLHPNFWGFGKMLYQQIVEKTFKNHQIPSITVLFPPSRSKVNGLKKLGFEEEGEVTIGDHRFNRFRLKNETLI
ncbi:MAG TPA: GNAT family protein [Roseivirga sp.]